MGTDTLTETDHQLLRQLVDAPERRSTLESRFADSSEPVTDRLAVLVDSGLIRQADVTYELTESGRRVLAAPSDGTVDSGIDVPPTIKRELQDHGADAACTRAVRAVSAFLTYWGEATPSELRDAVYAERQAGYEDRQAWWNGCIEPALKTLPTVRSPTSTKLTAKWRYDGTPGIDEAETDDGRQVLGSTNGQPFGNARQAIEAETRSATQRAVARHVFAYLETHGHADTERLELLIVEATEQEAQSGSIAVVADVLRSIPSVVRDDGVWRYQHAAAR